jgi:hypothetical protein
MAGEHVPQVERTPAEIMAVVDHLEDRTGEPGDPATITAAYVAACVLRWVMGERWPIWMAHPDDRG